MTTVLVVDDLEENRYLLTALLQGNGYRTVQANNGAEAFELATREPPDLIITDVMMPVMDGFELCRRWKDDEKLRHIPFIVYTATYTDPKDEALALSLGADRFLVKPQTPAVVIDMVREVLAAVSRGAGAVRERPSGDAGELLRLHNEALMRKLQDKVMQLEADVAKRKASEAALERAVTHLRIAGRMAKLGGFTLNTATQRMECSEEAAAILELPPAQAHAIDDCLGFFAPEWRDRVRVLIDVCAREGAPLDIEVEAVSARGRRLWVRMLAEASRGESERARVVQGALQDISERKRADGERVELERQLLQAQKMESIGRLAGGVAHDFNNLLAVVLSYLGFAMEALKEDDPMRADLAEAVRAAERAAALTRQLLVFSRKQALQPRVLDLNEVVANMEGMLRRLIREDVEIVRDLAPERCTVFADTGQLEQVLMNLAVNARDAMPEGGRLVIETRNVDLGAADSVVRAGAQPGPYVRLSVIDTGSGMDADTMSLAFEPFFTTKEVGKGTGLGLATVHGIVEQSGGVVSLRSAPGKGTTVEMFLPRDLSDASTAPDLKPKATTARGHGTILVVEDEPALRKVIARMLGDAGYQVLSAGDGPEALRVSRECAGEISLLLTDAVMPTMSGPTLARELLKERPTLRVLIMSGYSEVPIGAEGGAVHSVMLSKPFTGAELARRVRELLDAGPGATGVRA